MMRKCLLLSEVSGLPACVSGIIYVSDVELGWEPPVKSWLAKLEPAYAAGLSPCFDKYVGPLLDYIRISARPVMYNEQACSVNTLLTLLNGALKRWVAGGILGLPWWCLMSC